jgi:hypothetical protein
MDDPQDADCVERSLSATVSRILAASTGSDEGLQRTLSKAG